MKQPKTTENEWSMIKRIEMNCWFWCRIIDLPCNFFSVSQYFCNSVKYLSKMNTFDKPRVAIVLEINRFRRWFVSRPFFSSFNLFVFLFDKIQENFTSIFDFNDFVSLFLETTKSRSHKHSIHWIFTLSVFTWIENSAFPCFFSVCLFWQWNNFNSYYQREHLE